ncbi:MAG TPA: c-type cytochrome biogenesis protein CcmI [Pyrinomonadaceae bacterium]|nr:c-type cytochrome biogenesis protein CcmI [Pyrinomonadaceae bacterium]
MLFWFIAAGLIAIGLAFILPTLLQRDPPKDDRAKQANVEVYRDQLTELRADLTNGLISADQYDHDRDQIERRMLDDVTPSQVETGKPLSDVALKRIGVAIWFGAVASLLIVRIGLHFSSIELLASAQPTIGIFLFAVGAIFLFVRTNRAMAYALALLLPLMGVAIYLKVGNAGALNPSAMAAASEGTTQASIEANVAALAKRLEQTPDDADGWAMLGRSYVNLQKYKEASDAYARATTIKSADPDLLTEYAFVVAMNNGRQLKGRPYELVKQALQIAPENPKALELAGSAEFQAKNYDQAIAYWQKLLQKTPADSELGRSVSANIEEAKTLAGKK